MRKNHFILTHLVTISSAVLSSCRSQFPPGAICLETEELPQTCITMQVSGDTFCPLVLVWKYLPCLSILHVVHFLHETPWHFHQSYFKISSLIIPKSLSYLSPVLFAFSLQMVFSTFSCTFQFCVASQTWCIRQRDMEQRPLAWDSVCIWLGVRLCLLFVVDVRG